MSHLTVKHTNEMDGHFSSFSFFLIIDKKMYNKKQPWKVTECSLLYQMLQEEICYDFLYSVYKDLILHS